MSGNEYGIQMNCIINNMELAGYSQFNNPTSPIFAERSSSATHPCQYIVYFGPTIHPSFSNSSGNISDSSRFTGHWNGPSMPSEIPSSDAFPAMNLHYQSWEHHSTPFSTSDRQIDGSSQPSIPPVSQRSARNSSDMPSPGTFMHPFVAGNSFGTRTASAVASSFIPPYPGRNARACDRVQTLQAYYQHYHPSVTGQSSKPVTITPNASNEGLLLRWGSFGPRELTRFKELLEN
ncbi:uncharacterized protein [Gossypium hirsutum]|uniref:Uncharacterized protein n=1 Tax=Gossypium hirsutum TaxID=3635 RepID=A0A1U8NFJ0_GOSHI|nr:uncharacterized protein LOC107947736 [Gossypium hirsutum]